MTPSPLFSEGSSTPPEEIIKIDKGLPPSTTKTDSGGSEPGTNDGPKPDKGL